MCHVERFFPIHFHDFTFFESSRSNLFDFDADFVRMKAKMNCMHEEMDRHFELMRKHMIQLAPVQSLGMNINAIEPFHPLVVEEGETKLKLYFNVHGFKADEVQVKLIGDNLLQVIANSEETTENKEQKCHHLSQYTLPKGILPDNIKPVMSKDGVLTIEAPAAIEIKFNPEEKDIPIELVL